MRIGLVAEAWNEGPRGNRTTVERWLDAPHGAEVWPLDPDAARRFGGDLDVVHGYHLKHGGVAAMELAGRLKRPLVVSLGGTDLQVWRARLAGHEELDRVLRAAVVITGAFAEFGVGLPGAFMVVPRSVEIPPESPHGLRGPGPLRALLPAGLRPVKGVIPAIALADRLHELGLIEDLRIVGAALDPDTTAEVVRLIATRPHVRRDLVPPDQMPGIYAGSDIVWNTSLHEGGSNALLEAFAAGRPVMASAVPGNLELLAEAPPQIALLTDLAAFERVRAYHEELCDQGVRERRRRAELSISHVRQRFSAAAEGSALRAVWKRATTS